MESGLEWIRNTASNLMNSALYRNWRGIHGARAEDIVSSSQVIHILGRSYSDQLEEFTQELLEFTWFTYRRQFPPLPFSDNVTSDCGWGCMLRAAQMALARAITHVAEGSDVIRLFEDKPGAPLGIHRLIDLAVRRFNWEKAVGKWYTPSEAVLLLREALMLAEELTKLRIYLSTDTTVVLEEIREASNRWSSAILIAISLRLGTKNINPLYYAHLKNVLSLPNCIGLIGGKPTHALYLIGRADESLIGLDPHVRQTYRPLEELLVKEEEQYRGSFHTTTPTVIPIAKLDPSLTVLFLINDEDELLRWRRIMIEIGIAADASVAPNHFDPVCTIVERREEMEECNEDRIQDDDLSLADFEIL